MRTTWTLASAVVLGVGLVAPLRGQPPTAPARQTLVVPLAAAFRGMRLECLATYGPAAPVCSVAFGPDGKTLYAGGYREIVVWDIAGAKLRSRIALPEARGVVRALTPVQGGRRLAVAIGAPGTPGAVALLDASDGKPLGVLAGPKDAVTALAASRDERWLAAANGDGAVYVWKLADAPTGTKDAAADATGTPPEFSRTRAPQAAGDNDGSEKPADKDGSEESAGEAPAMPAGGVKPAVVLSGHVEAVACIAFSPDGKYLASAGADRMVRLWDTTSWKTETLLRQSESVLGVAFRPDGERLLAAFGGPSDQGLRLYAKARPQPANPAPKSKDATDAPPPEKDYSISLRAIDTGAGMPQHIAFAPTGAVAYVACSDRTVKAVNVERGNVGASLRGHQDWVYCAAVSPDGTKLASGGADGTVRLWHTFDNSLAAVLVPLAPRSDRWLIVTPQGFYAASAPDVVRWREAAESSPSPFANSAAATKPSTGAKSAPGTKSTAGPTAKAAADISARLAAFLSQQYFDPPAVARALAEKRAPSPKPAAKPKPQTKAKPATSAGGKKTQ